MGLTLGHLLALARHRLACWLRFGAPGPTTTVTTRRCNNRLAVSHNGEVASSPSLSSAIVVASCSAAPLFPSPMLELFPLSHAEVPYEDDTKWQQLRISSSYRSPSRGAAAGGNIFNPEVWDLAEGGGTSNWLSALSLATTAFPVELARARVCVRVWEAGRTVSSRLARESRAGVAGRSSSARIGVVHL